MKNSDDLRYEVHLLRRQLQIAVELLAKVSGMHEEKLTTDIEEQAKQSFPTMSYWEDFLALICEGQVHLYDEKNGIELRGTKVLTDQLQPDILHVEFQAMDRESEWLVRGTYHTRTGHARIDGVDQVRSCP